MRLIGRYYIDDPAVPVHQAVVSYEDVTTAAGNALGTTLVCAGLANEPSYQGMQVKVLDGAAAGQARAVAAHVGNTITVAAGFTNNLGAAVQIVAGIRFVVISIAGGGGAAPVVSPSIGLWMFGVCDAGMAASLNTLVMSNLAGFPNDIFNNEFWVQIIHNANAPGVAPERQIRRITDYVGATGTFTIDALTANAEAGDLVAVFHESIMRIEVLGFGTLDGSSATIPADSTRLEANDYFNGCMLMPTEGACAFQPRRIVDYTAAGGIFQIDPANPFIAVTGLVDYVIIGDQTDLVPWADSILNYTPGHVIGNKSDSASNAVTASVVNLLRFIIGGGAVNLQLIFDLVNAMMTTYELGGTLTATGGEDFFWSHLPGIISKPIVVKLNTTNLAAGDSITVRTYEIIGAAGLWTLSDVTVFAGVQAIPLKKIRLDPSKWGTRVSVQQTIGVLRNFGWEAYYDL